MPGTGLLLHPSQGNFKTIDEAWKYAESRYCYECKKEIQSGVKDPYINCSGEWMVDEE